MKVTTSSKEKVLCRIAHLGFGECFKFPNGGDKFYIKTDHFRGCKQSPEVAIVEISSGCLYWNYSDHKVVPVKVEAFVTIKE